MKLVAIIVVYNPDNDQLLHNVNRLIKDVDQLLIYKNSRIEIEDVLREKFEGKIIFLGNEINCGIGKALNEGVVWAEKNSFSHILTLDQDSYFDNNNLEEFKKAVNQNVNDTIGLFCPNIENRGVILIDTVEEMVFVPDSITSGTIIPVNIFKKTGYFDEKLFIDAVDYEFCYRIYSDFGLRTVIFPRIVLKHEVGHSTRIIFGFITDNYSAFRTFHIVRNHILMWRRYPKLFQKGYKITLLRVHICYRVVKIIIGEKDKVSKLKAILFGIYQGLYIQK